MTTKRIPRPRDRLALGKPTRGIGKHNPGEEEALALYSIPFGR
jgi:hypothetical protein